MQRSGVIQLVTVQPDALATPCTPLDAQEYPIPTQPSHLSTDIRMQLVPPFGRTMPVMTIVLISTRGVMVPAIVEHLVAVLPTCLVHPVDVSRVPFSLAGFLLAATVFSVHLARHTTSR